MPEAMTSAEFRYTVFTPAYNRRHTLHRVYESLCAQDFRDFEWVLIDDGSTDGTREQVAAWAAEASFPVIYHHQQNSGKHAAYNHAVQLARGELFLVIDSDDGFLPQALSTMLKAWEGIEAAQRRGFSGVVTLCQYEDGRLAGDRFPASPFDTTVLELSFRHKVRGECWGFHRTEVLREYPFPIDPAVRFVPENIVWNAIARKYRVRCINEALRVFYQDEGVRLTTAQPERKAAVRGYFRQLVDRDIDYLRYDPATFLRYAVLYARYSLHARDWRFLDAARFTSRGAHALCIASSLPGVLVYLLDRLRAGNART